MACLVFWQFLVSWQISSSKHGFVAIFMILQKLLQRGQERDKFLAEVRQREEPDHVLELKQTIQIMQEKLDEREGEAFCTF